MGKALELDTGPENRRDHVVQKHRPDVIFRFGLKVMPALGADRMGGDEVPKECVSAANGTPMSKRSFDYGPEDRESI